MDNKTKQRIIDCYKNGFSPKIIKKNINEGPDGADVTLKEVNEVLGLNVKKKSAKPRTRLKSDQTELIRDLIRKGVDNEVIAQLMKIPVQMVKNQRKRVENEQRNKISN